MAPLDPSNGSIRIAGKAYEVQNGDIYSKDRLIGTLSEGGDFSVVLDGKPISGFVKEA